MVISGDKKVVEEIKKKGREVKEDFVDLSICKNCKNYDSGFCKEKKENVGEKGHCSLWEGIEELYLDNLTLEELHKKYRELLYIEDTKRIDVVLAIALSNELEGIPLWLLLVGASGDMKSVQLNALDGFYTHYLHKITSKTLVNGHKNKAKYPDLAPKLNKKIVIIRDMAPLLKLNPVEKGEVWGQLRDLYDGFAGTASGQGADIKYKDIKVTLIAGSTPAIDGQILIHQDLGTRELLYRTKGNKNKKKVMEKCLENEEYEGKITKELNEITTKYLKSLKINREYITEELIDVIKEIAVYISYMRATADIDSYTNTLRTDVFPEEPTRVIKQLKRIYVCLMSLDKDYKEERAIEILWHIARSSAFQTRVNVMDFLIKQEKEFSTSKISEALKMGKGTVQRELHVLWNLNLVKCRKEETNYPDRFYDYWTINQDHKFIKKYILKPSANI